MTELTLLKSHPQWGLANKIYETLTAHGYQTYFAGGCVRDLILGVPPKDLDIATAATPTQVKALFPRTIDVGENFGVTRVVENGQDIEVAAFRTDGDYKDGRHPEAVTFSSPQHDAERRDFTVNALFLDPSKGQVLDYVGGLEDLKKKVIKTVGVADERFREDHLRILRALRFAAQLGFKIDPQTFAAVQNKKESLKSVSGERVRDEILKLLKSPAATVGLDLLISSGVFEVLLTSPPSQAKALWEKIFPLPDDLRNEIFWLGLFWPLLEEKSQVSWVELEDRLKFTREERKAFKTTLEFISQREQWRQKRLGEKLLFIHQSIGPTLLAFSALSSLEWQSEFSSLKKEYEFKAPQGQLPPPFLKGEDVVSLTGPARGLALEEAYLAQLEGQVKSRDEALTWLQLYQKGIKK